MIDELIEKEKIIMFLKLNRTFQTFGILVASLCVSAPAALAECGVEASIYQQKLLQMSPFINQGDWLETLTIWLDPAHPEFIGVARVFLMHLVREKQIDPSTWEEVKPLLSGSQDVSLARKVVEYYWELQYQNATPSLDRFFEALEGLDF